MTGTIAPPALGAHRLASDVATPLVDLLGAALEGAGVRYCQWKGRLRAARWRRGEGDIDLLVDRSSIPAFRAVLAELEWKRALPAGGPTPPGVESFLGYDPALPRLLHVHAHYRLVLAEPGGALYHLPLEAAALAGTVRRPGLRAPGAEPELILFVLQATLRHRLRDAWRGGDPAWLAERRAELDALERAADAGRIAGVLARHFPALDAATFAGFVAALRPGAPARARLRARGRLRRVLAPHTLVGAARALAGRVAARLATGRRRPRLADGGALIALVGADGAGKTTCTGALAGWLGRHLAVTRAHLGRPPRSPVTLAVGALRRLAGGRDDRPDLTTLARALCTARDRYRLYRRARRFAARGGVALCERHPVAQNPELAGPQIPPLVAGRPVGRLARALERAEARYYARIGAPDVVLVLQVAPDVAVLRKTDEPAGYVRARAELVWHTDWSRTAARLVDAARSLPDVLADLRAAVWETL